MVGHPKQNQWHLNQSVELGLSWSFYIGDSEFYSSVLCWNDTVIFISRRKDEVGRFCSFERDSENMEGRDRK